MSPGLMLEYKSMLIDYRARRQHNVSLFRIKIYGRRLSIFPLVCVRGDEPCLGASSRARLRQSGRCWQKAREVRKRGRQKNVGQQTMRPNVVLSDARKIAFPLESMHPFLTQQQESPYRCGARRAQRESCSLTQP